MNLQYYGIGREVADITPGISAGYRLETAVYNPTSVRTCCGCNRPIGDFLNITFTIVQT